MNERTDPEHPGQDHYQSGVDLVREISNEFGHSPFTVRRQLERAEILLNGREWKGDKFFIQYDQIKGKKVEVVGPDRHWSFQYRG